MPALPTGLACGLPAHSDISIRCHLICSHDAGKSGISNLHRVDPELVGMLAAMPNLELDNDLLPLCGTRCASPALPGRRADGDLRRPRCLSRLRYPCAGCRRIAPIHRDYPLRHARGLRPAASGNLTSQPASTRGGRDADPGSEDRIAAVDDEFLAGDVDAFVRSEIEDQVGDIDGLAHALATAVHACCRFVLAGGLAALLHRCES